MMMMRAPVLTTLPGARLQPGRPGAVLAAALLLVTFAGAPPAPEEVAPRQDYAAVAELLSRFIAHETSDKELPAFSIALVDDQELVWAQGFGHADPKARTAATARTVYRVGSVSKLFTDLAVMQLVERGELDLDQPVTRYLPDFRPRNPFSQPITLRQLMAHRSGLVREPPVGNYFDPTEPSLAATVASLNQTELVYEPGTRSKYSNAGIAVVGYVLEQRRGRPFPELLQRAVLEPLGMRHSCFAPNPRIEASLATAFMWTYDGRTFEAPGFQLGMAPAGSMYSTVTDLGLFMSALFRAGGGVIRRQSLEEMYRPQFAEGDVRRGYGLGFAVAELEGHRLLRHGGAIYGFATELAFLPDEKLGAVAVTTVDVANRVVGRIVRCALRSMLAARAGKKLPEPDLTRPVDPKLARSLAGRYAGDDETIELVARGGRLWLTYGSTRAEVKSRGPALVVDDRHDYGAELVPAGEGQIELNGKSFRRVEARIPAPAPTRWRGLIGEYGWDHNTLYVLEREGRLWALIEWFELAPLTELRPGVFALPDDSGLYPGEKLIFERADDGDVTAVEAFSVRFARRRVGAGEGETFRIEPLRPVAELRKIARRAEPPQEEGDFRPPDLVELRDLEPSIRLDVRYATTNNFMSAVFYQQARAFLQRPAAEALVRAHRRLQEKGYGLLIHDAYRPWYVTKMFWDATPAEQKIFVADPRLGSRHNRGAAVDVTLCELRSGRVVPMVGGYDEMTERSYADYPGGTSRQRWHRELLREAMEAQGFSVYPYEWWHFDYRDWRQYPILNLTFEELGQVEPSTPDRPLPAPHPPAPSPPEQGSRLR